MTVFEAMHVKRGASVFSMGTKLLVLCGLALLMSLGAFFLDHMVDERAGREAAVIREVSQQAGGQQAILGPTLLVPYTVTTPAPSVAAPLHGMYVVFPETGDAHVTTSTAERRRSLFRVPVFHADAELAAVFNLEGVLNQFPAGAVPDLKHAKIVVGMSDARGALADALLTTNDGRVIRLAATDPVAKLTDGEGKDKLSLALFGADFPLSDATTHIAVSSTLKISGAQHLSVLPYAQSTALKIHGDWRSPGFEGGFSPVSRDVRKDGFDALWNVPAIARGIRAAGDAETISGLRNAGLAVSFIEVADPYQSMTRSVKYAPLFLGLVFLTYFVFEATGKERVHVAQYVLVGVAQLIFYLLLLSFAERVGFDFGFLLGGGATVTLLALNAGWVFRSRMQAARAFVAFCAMYTMIYLLLRLEDNALLAGALGSFAAVAAAMYFTRNLNWHDSSTLLHTATPSGGMPVGFRVGEL